MPGKGLFITFEGPDGSGKTTQIQRLAAELNRRCIPFVLSHEPGGTAIGDEIRKLILSPRHAEMEDRTEILLYAASRSQHVREKILPALNEGKLVLCDRFVDASIAYQGYGLRQPTAAVRAINRFATGGLTPDRTYLIDVSPATGRRRMRKRSTAEQGVTQTAGELDRIERRRLDYHCRVREGFLQLGREEKKRIVMVNGENEPDIVFHTILRDFNYFLAGRSDYTNRGDNL
ncbi:MAG: dTMP kinase [Sporolactobacillus sp.]|nr:dTMP kinase [Sporolactobacillus sp.]MCI1881027.1 dTMP kinase [Sporolactobacillus sp.]